MTAMSQSCLDLLVQYFRDFSLFHLFLVEYVLVSLSFHAKSYWLVHSPLPALHLNRMCTMGLKGNRADWTSSQWLPFGRSLLKQFCRSSFREKLSSQSISPLPGWVWTNENILILTAKGCLGLFIFPFTWAVGSYQAKHRQRVTCVKFREEKDVVS